LRRTFSTSTIAKKCPSPEIAWLKTLLPQKIMYGQSSRHKRNLLGVRRVVAVPICFVAQGPNVLKFPKKIAQLHNPGAATDKSHEGRGLPQNSCLNARSKKIKQNTKLQYNNSCWQAVAIIQNECSFVLHIKSSLSMNISRISHTW
jgi:hypothetical protein